MPCGQVKNPSLNNGAFIRTIEWKHMLFSKFVERIRGTVLTEETPFSPISPDEYEYPFTNNANQRLYQQYRKLATEIPKLLICG